MKYILDTYSFVWWHNNTSHLSDKVLAICEDMNNQLLFSTASIIELQVKLQTEQLKTNMSIMDMVTLQQTNGLVILPISLAHLACLETLPAHHTNCFERLLVAQTKVENAILITKNTQFSAYKIKTIW
jgi:PIN domain nuclease of toxin-antitoxin system